MNIPPLQGTGAGMPPFRVPVLTAPISTGVPPLIGDDELAGVPLGAPSAPPGGSARQDPPISLAGRLDTGNVLPETTKLALALESATRALQHGRVDQVLTELDAVWSNQLASDSPWYLRTAALQVLGRLGDAEQVMRDAIERLPRSAALLYLLGVHTAFRGQPDAARLANDHALALHPAEPLLWLQRAALAERGSMADGAAAMLAHVEAMEPAFPASQWLATLMRLGEGSARTPTPVMQRAIARLTPSSIPVVSDQPTATPPSALPIPPSVLEHAVRYGLTLLESPTQSARTATQASSASSRSGNYAGIITGPAPLPPVRAELPSWDTLILAAGVIVIVVIPPLRIPAMMICGACAMLIIARKLR